VGPPRGRAARIVSPLSTEIISFALVPSLVQEQNLAGIDSELVAAPGLIGKRDCVVSWRRVDLKRVIAEWGRDLRRATPGAIAIPEPDQDRQLMTVAPHAAAHRRPPSPPAARRIMSAMFSRRRRFSLDRGRRLAPAHRRHRKRPTPLFPPKTLSLDGRRRLARRPSATHKSPRRARQTVPLPPRGFLPGRLSGAGPGACPTVAKAGARNPSPYETKRRAAIDGNPALAPI
jgi:hypothetical protein